MPSALNLSTLEERRRQLIRFIEQHKPQGSPNNRVTVVFDGSPHIFGGMASPAAKVVFSQGESADDTIKRIVAQAQNAKNMIVVSDDRDVQYAVRALGAKVSGARMFLDQAKSSGKQDRAARKSFGKAKRGPAKKGPMEAQKYIPESEKSKITSEFGKIWLSPGRKRKDRS